MAELSRRDLLRTMLGLARVAALPLSMVWPFRKIFLPSEPTIIIPEIIINPMLAEFSLESIELEQFAEQLPDLLIRNDAFYKRLRFKEAISIPRSSFRVPLRIQDG